MKIFCYEITKAKKVRKVIFDTKKYSPRVEIQFYGDGWGLNFGEFEKFATHFNALSDKNSLPDLTTEQKVHIMKIFYKEACEFEII